MYNKKSELI